MRRILVDHARARSGQARRVGEPMPDEEAGPRPESEVDLLALDDALTRLAELDPQQALVELRYFGGSGSRRRRRCWASRWRP